MRSARSQRGTVSKIRVLILNSDRLSQKSLYELLSRCGYSADIAGSVKESLAYLEKEIYRIVLADIDGTSGIELLKIIKSRSYPSEVIVLTSYGNSANAFDSIEMGSFGYLIKPVEDNKIISAIEKALAKRPVTYLRPAAPKIPAKDNTYHGMVGASPTMNEIYSLIERISDSKATVLLRGESGTGKRMIARAIHKADKKRRDRPFIEISCGALPREIIESELFGHTRGAFTGAINDRKGRFELADEGTILLDDIDAFSLDLQVKLLRVLQQKEFEKVGDHRTIKVDVRIIASSNQDLEKLVAEKKFREDLYYRINVISICVPPLRERKGDLAILTEYFFKNYTRENHKNIMGISREVIDILKAYNWPGNVRELENIIERAVILDRNGLIENDDLPEIILSSQPLLRNDGSAGALAIPASLKDMLQEPEKVYILQVLQEVGWNKKKAAVKLGVNRTTLYNKLRKYNLIP